jgi:hypothetical protein
MFCTQATLCADAYMTSIDEATLTYMCRKGGTPPPTPTKPHPEIFVLDLVFFEKKFEFFEGFCFSNFSKNGSEKFEKKIT